MLNFSKFRFFFILGVCLLSIIFLVPNFYGKSEITAFPTYFPKKQFNLGLDLQGGSHLLLEVVAASQNSLGSPRGSGWSRGGSHPGLGVAAHTD